MMMFSLVEERDLVDFYTQEEIEVEFILNCLFAESKNQRSRDANDIMATSALEFISKISGHSELHTTLAFQGRLGRIQGSTTVFDEFIWVFRDRQHQDCQWHEMCCSGDCCQEQLGCDHQECETALR